MPDLLSRRLTFWVVAALIALLFAITNLPWQLDDYDQAKQAFTSFEMINQGHWLYQHTPDNKIATKPPLVGWFSAACYAIGRSWEVAWRLPSLVAAFSLLILLTRAATEAYGATAGFIAMSAFGLNLLSPRLATLVRTDMPLALIIFLLGLVIWRKVRAAEPWQPRDRVVMFALLTASMLIKGPIVYAFLLPGIVVFQWRNRSAERKANAWCGWWPWIASVAIFLAWVAGGIAAQPKFYEQVVLEEFAARFGETVHRPRPFYFYFPHLLHKFAPWSVLGLALGIVAWRSEKLALGERWRRLSPETTWLLCWSLGGLIVMSLIPSKRVDRIFPIVPPLCLLVAAQVSRAWNSETLGLRVRSWCGIALVVASIFASTYSAHKIITGFRADRGALARFGRAVRAEAAARGWRYEVVGKEEGLLLYLHRMRFVSRGEAARRWNAGALETLVVPAEHAPSMQQALKDAVPSGLEATITVNDRPRRYLLLKRQ